MTQTIDLQSIADGVAAALTVLVPLLGAVCGYLAGKLRAAAKRAKAVEMGLYKES